MEKFLENLKEAENIIRTVDHIGYVTFPLIKDKRLLLKIIFETKTAVANCINSILQYEYLYKRIRLYKDPRTNLQTFREKCAQKYQITEEEIKSIIELFEIVEEHKKSIFEFVKNEKVIILSENLEQKVLTIEKIKKFLVLAKGILKKSEDVILRKI